MENKTVEEKTSENTIVEDNADEKSAAKSSAKKKKSPVRIVLFVILGLIAAIIIAALGFVLYVMNSMAKTEPTVDDIAALMAEAPVGTSDRFGVASNGDVAVKIYKNDIWWYLGEAYGEDIGYDIEAEITGALSDYGVDYKGIGINLTEADGASVDFSAAYKGHDIVLNVPLELAFYGETLRAGLRDGVRVAGITVPSKLIEKYSGFDLDSICLEFTPETYFFEKIDNVTPADGFVAFSGRLSETPFDGIKNFDTNRILKSLIMMDEFADVTPALYLLDKGDDDWQRPVADLVEKDGDAFRRYALELLYLNYSGSSKNPGIKSLNEGFTDRWLTGYDEAYKSTTYFSLEYTERLRLFENTVQVITTEFRSHKLTVGENGWEYRGKPFSFEGLFGGRENSCITKFSDDNSRLVIIAGKGMNDPYVPKASEAFPESYIAAAGLDGERQYNIGLLYIDPANGWSYLIYRSVADADSAGAVSGLPVYNVRLLTEDEVAAIEACPVEPAVFK